MDDGECGGKAFELERFLPYLLNQAAEAASRSFQAVYRAEYGMTRTQWRVMAHLGRFGALTAADICRRSHVEKTKVSRAVAAMEARGWLARARSAEDRRRESLSLTPEGMRVFAHLGRLALAHDDALRRALDADRAAELEAALRRLIDSLGPQAGPRR
jgi:DNA-binding MarR family transcriptional regulator